MHDARNAIKGRIIVSERDIISFRTKTTSSIQRNDVKFLKDVTNERIGKVTLRSHEREEKRGHELGSSAHVNRHRCHRRW